ncbi:hypothetical protein D3C78_1493370 [compost metagenome]
MSPFACRQVIGYFALLVKDRRDKQRISQHILTIQGFRSRIFREFKHHSPHRWQAKLRSLYSRIEQVWHNAAFQLGEMTSYIYGFRIICPRHPVRFASVQTAVAGKQAKGQPALEHMHRSRIFKAANIMAPEAEARNT